MQRNRSPKETDDGPAHRMTWFDMLVIAHRQCDIHLWPIFTVLAPLSPSYSSEDKEVSPFPPENGIHI
jgi:hypothetical protein